MRDVRWQGERGRLEVWYTTVTDPVTRTGFWFHTELVARGDGTAYVHGWAAVFEPGAAPVWARWGPRTVRPGLAAPDELVGVAGEMSWDLRRSEDGSLPLFTFPRWAWKRAILPAAQVVPSPSARYDGEVRVGSRTYVLAGAPGASARIYGHGNAKRWAWLHADLGDGDVLELVAAVSRRPGLSRLPALPLLQLRVDGKDWPADPMVAAPLFRAQLGLPDWRVSGVVGRRRLQVRVHQPPGSTLAVDYVDPDGATATCQNCEVATAEVTLLRLARGGWQVEREWTLDGTAHAEVGRRP